MKMQGPRSAMRRRTDDFGLHGLTLVERSLGLDHRGRLSLRALARP